MASDAGIRSGTAVVGDTAGDPAAGEDPGRPATRRRGESLESAIYDAALDQLARLGYSGLTMEGVAAAARTGKASLYRRWSHKDDLIVDALDAAMPHVGEPPDTGSLRDDLIALLGGTAEFVTSAVGRALQHSIMSAERKPSRRPVRRSTRSSGESSRAARSSSTRCCGAGSSTARSAPVR
jgi:AcrR family transcriptional regulator